MKNAAFVLAILIVSLFGTPHLLADTAAGQKSKIVVFPAELGTIDEEYADLVSEMIHETGKFEIINLSNILIANEKELPYDSGYVNEDAFAGMGTFLGADSGMLVEVLEFVPDSESVQAELLLEVRIDLMDFHSGLMDRIEYITIKRAGIISMFGKAPVSDNFQATVSAAFSHKFKREFNEFFGYESKILAVEGEEIVLKGGLDDGIQPGDIFELFDDKNQVVVGNKSRHRSYALSRVESIGRKTNRSKILRRWGRLEPGYKARELITPPWQWQLRSLLAPTGFISALEINGRLSLWRNWGFSARIAGIKDSRDERDFAFGLGGFILRPVLQESRHQLQVSARFNADYVARQDDESNLIGAFLFSAAPGLNYVFSISRSYDVVLGAGYIISVASDWQRPTSEEEEDLPVIWDGKKAKLKPEGFYLTFGISFIIF